MMQQQEDARRSREWINKKNCNSQVTYCRTCAKILKDDTENPRDIFDFNYKGIPFAEMVLETSGVEVLSKDLLPRTMCKSCISQLETAYSFKTQCIAADKKLKRLFTETNVAFEFISEPIAPAEDSECMRIKQELKNVYEILNTIENEPCTDDNELKVLYQLQKSLKRAEEVVKLSCAKEKKQEIIPKIKTEVVPQDISDDDIDGRNELLKCCGCPGIFPSMKCLKNHAENMHKKEVAPLTRKEREKTVRQCKICFETFIGRQYIEQGHSKTDFINRLRVVNIACCGCNGVFDSTEALKTHASEHLDKKTVNPAMPFECEICFRRFSAKRGLSDHKVHSVRRKIELINNSNAMASKVENEESISFEQVEYLEVDEPFCDEMVTEIEVDTPRSGNRKTPLDCCGCEMSFFSSDQLKRHGIAKHKKPHVIEDPNLTVKQCIICFESFPMANSNPPPGHSQSRLKLVSIPCCGCDKNFDSLMSLAKHSEEHIQNKLDEDQEKQFECGYCFKRFMNKRQQVEHRKNIKHIRSLLRKEDKPKYELEDTTEARCCGCKEVFAEIEELEEHLKMVHEPCQSLIAEEKRPYQCDKCFKRFKFADSLERHIYRPYMVKNHVCKTCGLLFVTRQDLLSHEQEQHSDTVYECQDCCKTMTKKTAYLNHISRHKLTLVCSFCGFITNSKMSLKLHTVQHTGEKNFACTVCQKKFRSRNLVSIHMRTHTGYKPYACKFCQKSYAHYSDWKRHEVTHTGDYPFVCEYCDKKFARRGHYEQHLASHE